MSNSHTMSFRSRWLNYIMHLTAAIAERKQDLTKYHALKTFFDVVTIFLLEGVLAIVSIPLYFSFRSGTVSADNDFNVQYVIRRTLVFTLFILLGVIFLAKMTVIGEFVLNRLQQSPQIGNVALPSPQITDILTAPADEKLAAPAVTNIDVSNARNFRVQGTSKPFTTVLLSIQQKEISVQQEYQILTAQTDANGAWQISSPDLIAVHAGTFVLQGSAYDSSLHFKSQPGNSVEFTYQATWQESLVRTMDFVANILIFSFLGIGLLVVFLTF